MRQNESMHVWSKQAEAEAGAAGRKERIATWGEKPLVGVVGGDGVAAVEGLQDPGDAPDLAVQVRPPLLSERLQVLGRHRLLPSSTQNAGRSSKPTGGPCYQLSSVVAQS